MLQLKIAHFQCYVLVYNMILALEGYTLPTWYIIKEMTVIFENNNLQHFQFAAPTDFQPTGRDLYTIRFTTKYINEIAYSDNSLLLYPMIDCILQKLSSQTIYVAGHCAYQFLSTKLPTTRIIDVCTKHDFKYPKELPTANCFKQHRPRYCSMAKATYVKHFMDSLDNKENFHI